MLSKKIPFRFQIYAFTLSVWSRRISYSLMTKSADFRSFSVHKRYRFPWTDTPRRRLLFKNSDSLCVMFNNILVLMHVVHIQTIKDVTNMSVLPSARSRLQRNASFAIEYRENMLQRRQLAFLWIFSQMTTPKMHTDQFQKCQMLWVIALGLSLSLSHLSTFSWNNKLSVSQQEC